MGHVRAEQAAIVGQQAVDLALDVGRLGPHGAAAREPVDLVQQLGEQDVRAVVPDRDRGVDLVGLVDGRDRLGHVPEVLDRDVVPDAAELALETQAPGVEGTRVDRVEGRAALRVRVVVVVAVIARAVVVPAGRGVDEPCRVELADDVGQAELGVGRSGDLTPALVVDDLRKDHVSRAEQGNARLSTWKAGKETTHPGEDTRIASQLRHEHFQLALKLRLLVCVGQQGLDGTVGQRARLERAQCGHILDHEQADLVTGLVEQRRFHLDL